MERNTDDKEQLKYSLNMKRVIILAIFLLLIWGSIWFLIYLKADEVTRDPCSICAEKIGDNITCYLQSSGGIITRIYFQNNTIVQTFK